MPKSSYLFPNLPVNSVISRFFSVFFDKNLHNKISLYICTVKVHSNNDL
jgi:hypothetical protein